MKPAMHQPTKFQDIQANDNDMAQLLMIEHSFPVLFLSPQFSETSGPNSIKFWDDVNQ